MDFLPPFRFLEAAAAGSRTDALVACTGTGADTVEGALFLALLDPGLLGSGNFPSFRNFSIVARVSFPSRSSNCSCSVGKSEILTWRFSRPPYLGL